MACIRRSTIAVWSALAGLLIVGGIALASELMGCGSSGSCTPADQGLGGAQSLSFRQLPSPDAVDVDCAQTRVVVVGSGAALDALDAGVDGASVDFTRERVVVRQGNPVLGVNWIATQGDTAYVGLLGCTADGDPAPGCITNALAIENTTVVRADSRTCPAVACGIVQKP